MCKIQICSTNICMNINYTQLMEKYNKKGTKTKTNFFYIGSGTRAVVREMQLHRAPSV